MAVATLLAVTWFQSMVPEDTEQISQEEYPESLIALLERNPETKDFVLDYPQNKDIDFEIDLSDEVTKGTIPLFLQWDVRWGYKNYGSDFLAITGCGPTCLSMVRCGLSGDDEWNPLAVANMAEEQGFYVDGVGSSWDLMTAGAAQLGLIVNRVIYDEAHIVAELESGRPIICAMRPGDFTTTGHFIVLTGVDEDGQISVCDPNSRMNSDKSWKVDALLPQIKNLWSYTYPD
ncbi:MAG: C39 family peptidase [Acetatifactor sp.]